jgi:hypothetical protein
VLTSLIDCLFEWEITRFFLKVSDKIKTCPFNVIRREMYKRLHKTEQKKLSKKNKTEKPPPPRREITRLQCKKYQDSVERRK